MHTTEGWTITYFLNWLDHEVFPFFGEGERRTFVANFNIFDSIQEKEKYSKCTKRTQQTKKGNFFTHQRQE